MNKKERRRAESDRRMLDAAIALIARHGTGGASLGQIGIDAGYSRGLPTHRFGTKQALLETVIDATEGWFYRRIDREVGALKGLEALRRRVRLQMELAAEHPEFSICMFHLIVDSTGTAPELAPRIAKLQQGYRENLRKYLLEACERGELEPGVDIDQNVRTILGTISGVCLQALVEGRPERLHGDADHVCTMITRAVASEETAP